MDFEGAVGVPAPFGCQPSAEEIEKEREEIKAQLDALSREIDAKGETAERVIALAKLVERAHFTHAVNHEMADGAALTETTLARFDEALVVEPESAARLHAARGSLLHTVWRNDDAISAYVASLDADPRLATFDALRILPPSELLDAAVLDACPKVRPQVGQDVLVRFVATCLDAADHDASRLRWNGVERDLDGLRQANAEAERANAVRTGAEVERRQEEPSNSSTK